MLIFVKYLKIGVKGTALATIIAQAISMIIALICLKKSHFIFEFNLKNFKVDFNRAIELAKVGIPISFQELMVRISFL